MHTVRLLKPSQVATVLLFFLDFSKWPSLLSVYHLVAVQYSIVRGTVLVRWQSSDLVFCDKSVRFASAELIRNTVIGRRYVTDSPDCISLCTVQSLSQVVGVLAFNWFALALQG
jgi:hypothetical protein